MNSIQLAGGFIYQPVIKDGLEFFDDNFLRVLDRINNSDDELRDNYDIKQIRRMSEYGYIYKDDPADIIYMTGIQDFGNGAYRLTSRTYITPEYRTGYWRSPDKYQMVKHQMDNLLASGKAKLLFKSREKANPAGLNISRRLAPEYFGDWEILPGQIELRWKDNWQWILYKNITGNQNDNLFSLQVQS